jgi:hypothetical protein
MMLKQVSQETPQSPQFAVVVVGVSQPSSAFAVQCANPGAHDECGMTQLPSHCTGAFGCTWESDEQLWAQPPQLAGSVFLSTQLDPQRSGVGAAQLDEHLPTPPLVEQRPSGGVQDTLQPPQVAGRVKSVSHPSFGLDVQCPNPERHAEGWRTHAPPTHCTEGLVTPGLTWGSAAQSNPHAPQFFGSVCVSMHRPSHSFGVGVRQSGTHENGVVDVWHSGAVAGQACVQLPHVCGSVRLASHPSVG